MSHTELPGAFALDPDGTWRALDRYDGPALAASRGEQSRFHIMVKPAGSACNLDCTYCFYLSKATLPAGPGSGRMSDATLEQFIRQYIEGVTGPEVVFSWQGGEPTLLGVDFFRRAVDLERKYAKPHQTIQNDLQTNGTLLDEDWCRFLKEHDFLVGLSIDGPKKLHDAFRVAKDGKPTFDRVFAAAKLLRKHDVPFNTLTCINRLNARYPLDVYRFLRRELGVRPTCSSSPSSSTTASSAIAPQSWDPAVLPRQGDPEARPGQPQSVVTDWSVDPDDWGTFLCKAFDEWRRARPGQGAGQPLRDAGGAAHGLAVAGVRLRRDLRQGTRRRARRRHLLLRPLRLPRVPGRQHPRGQADATRSSRAPRSSSVTPRARPCRASAASARTCRDCWGECPKNRILRTSTASRG